MSIAHFIIILDLHFCLPPLTCKIFMREGMFLYQKNMEFSSIFYIVFFNLVYICICVYQSSVYREKHLLLILLFPDIFPFPLLFNYSRLFSDEPVLLFFHLFRKLINIEFFIWSAAKYLDTHITYTPFFNHLVISRVDACVLPSTICSFDFPTIQALHTMLNRFWSNLT